MSAWPQVELQEFSSFQQGGRLKLSGKHFVDNGFPAYGAGGMNGRLPTAEFDRDAIVLSAIGARCGKCFLAEGEWTSLANTQVILPDPSKADIRFLWYQLNDEKRWPRRGAGQPFIRPADVKSHKVTFPPLKEQRRIAAVLDGADALRRRRREALALLDTLPAALFAEMFGDPVSNPKRWPKGRIGDALEDVRYGTSKKAGVDGELPILRMGNVTSGGQIDLTDMKRITLDPKDVPKHTVRRGDILFNRTNSADLVGKTAVFDRDEPHAFAGYLVRARTKPRHVPEYVAGYLNSAHGKAKLRNMAKNIVGMANINAKEMQAIPILLPDEATQRGYKRRVEAIRTKRQAHEAHLAQLDTLFASLQSRAFAGEL